MGNLKSLLKWKKEHPILARSSYKRSIQRHPEKQKEYSRKYYETHRKEVIASKQRYQKTPKGKAVAKASQEKRYTIRQTQRNIKYPPIKAQKGTMTYGKFGGDLGHGYMASVKQWRSAYGSNRRVWGYLQPTTKGGKSIEGSKKIGFVGTVPVTVTKHITPYKRRYSIARSKVQSKRVLHAVRSKKGYIIGYK